MRDHEDLERLRSSRDCELLEQTGKELRHKLSCTTVEKDSACAEAARFKVGGRRIEGTTVQLASTRVASNTMGFTSLSQRP